MTRLSEQLKDPNFLSTDCEEEIGIPHVPWMIFQAELERDQELLRRGICPTHNIQMTVERDREFCVYCEQREHLYDHYEE